jgi:hypothetical protein
MSNTEQQIRENLFDRVGIGISGQQKLHISDMFVL